MIVAGRYGQLGEIGLTPTRSWKHALYKCLKHLETTSIFLICIMVTNGSCNIAIGPIFKILLCFPPFERHKKTRVPLPSSIASGWIQMATHQDQSMESWDKICGCPSLFLLASLLPGRCFVSICFKIKFYMVMAWKLWIPKISLVGILDVILLTRNDLKSVDWKLISELQALAIKTNISILIGLSLV